MKILNLLLLSLLLITTTHSSYAEKQSSEQSHFDQSKKAVVCVEPLPVFTLGEKSNPTDKQVSELCSCIWNRFPAGGWEQRTAALIRNKQDPGWRGTALASRFSDSLKECGGYKL